MDAKHNPFLAFTNMILKEERESKARWMERMARHREQRGYATKRLPHLQDRRERELGLADDWTEE
jgi:hypothetical protein